MHKLKSVKLWLLIILIAFTGFLTYLGTINGKDYLDFIKWASVTYGVLNVATKATGNTSAKLTDKIEVKNKG